jgi:hypothetical protein
MGDQPAATRSEVVLTWCFAGLAVLVGGVLIAAAALAHAPPAVLPLVIVVGMGGPMLAAWELHSVAPRLRARRTTRVAPLDEGSLAALRRRLDQLPETQHPLGW